LWTYFIKNKIFLKAKIYSKFFLFIYPFLFIHAILLAYYYLGFLAKKQLKQRKKFFKSIFCMKKILIALIILGLISWGGFEWKYSTDLKKTVSDNPTEIEVEISGSISSIAQYLAEKNLIVSEYSFVRYLKKEGLDSKIQAGYNVLSADMTIPEIAEKLLIAQAKSITVYIPEGFTLEEVDEYLSKNTKKRDALFAKGEFLQCVQKTCDFSDFEFLPENRKEWEGYFFPATYSIKSKELSPQTLGEEMLLAFKTYAKKYDAFENPKRSLEELVIMASMIEKESSDNSDKSTESAMIADVLWKRIDDGIPLGVDATIRYALGIKSDALTVKNLNTQNAFNTRKNLGLPPHAISNFTAHSLKAAINPKPNPYYYYLHADGKIHYGKTNAQHEQNKQEFCGGSCE
jgi:UPF0755 protein